MNILHSTTMVTYANKLTREFTPFTDDSHWLVHEHQKNNATRDSKLVLPLPPSYEIRVILAFDVLHESVLIQFYRNRKIIKR